MANEPNYSSNPSKDEPKKEKVRVIPLEYIDEFPGHPFKVLDDESMQKLMNSIEEIGVQSPIVARINEDNDELFDFLGNATNRRILTLVYDSQRTTISENYIAETIGCEIAEVRAAIEFMEKYGMLDKSDVMVGKDKNMTLYTMSRPDGSREFILLRIIGAFGKNFIKKRKNTLRLSIK